jgi:hypothetical protein
MNNKIFAIIIIGVVLVLIYYMKTRHTSEKFSTINGQETESIGSVNILPDNLQYVIDDMEDSSASQNDRRFITKNTNTDPNNYKKINYQEGNRAESGDWTRYFDDNNNLIGDSQNMEQTFAGVDETVPFDRFGTSCHATFSEKKRATCGSNQDCDVEELFNPEYYLPQEQNDEWWETLDQPIPLKDRHLININKPIGINTIGSSLKNPSYDLRGTPACPKFAISPFMNSSIDPDTNIKSWNY